MADTRRRTRIRGGYDPALYKSAMYYCWANMKTRCENTRTADFARYGARGISICEEWKTFVGFHASMAASHRDGLTLDRIDNNRGYSPDNCRWVDRTVQANNRRSSRLISLHGETRTLAQWIKTTNLKASTVRQRFYTLGWSIERALGEVCHR